MPTFSASSRCVNPRFSLNSFNPMALLLTWIKAIVDHSDSAGQFHAGHRATLATRRRFSLAWCEGASCLVAIRRVLAASTLQFSIIHAAPARRGFVSPSLRWWPSWWWSLHLRSFRCRLLDGSHNTRLTNVRQIESIQTTPKPLQTLAFIGVSQPHDGDEKTADATATAAPRHGHTQGRHGHVTTATPRHGHSHDVTTTATTGTDMIAYKGTCPHIAHDTPHRKRTNIRANRRSIEHMY